MKEVNYIDAKRAQAIRKEVRRLLSRDYSRAATVSALNAIAVGADFDDEAVWLGQLVDRLRIVTDTPDYVDALCELAACAYAENRVEFQRKKIERKGYKLSDTGAANLFVEKSRDYVDALCELAACAYAENRVEFQRKKIERKGYKLSDTGAANLFVEKSREYKAESRYPEGLLEAIEFFIDAARGRISRPFGFNPTGW